MAADPKRNDGKGSLEHLAKDPATASRFKQLVGADGKWPASDESLSVPGAICQTSRRPVQAIRGAYTV